MAVSGLGLETIGVRLTVDGLSAYTRDLGLAGASTRQFRDALFSLDTSSHGLGSGVTRFLSELGKGFDQLGTLALGAVATVTGAMTAFASVSLSAAADFEQAMANAASVTMGDMVDTNGITEVLALTSEQFERMRREAIRLGQESKFSATEVATAIEMLGRNGLTAEQIVDGAAEAAINLSQATGADLPLATDIATDAMIIFGEQASDLGHVVDMLAGATIASKFNIRDMGYGISAAGGIAAAAGLEIDDFITTVAFLAPQFRSGRDAGTSFKTFITSLVPKSETAADAMRNLGLYTGMTDQQMLKARESIAAVEAEMAGLDPTVKGYEDKLEGLRLKHDALTQSLTSGHSAFFDETGNIRSMAEIIDTLNESFDGLTPEHAIANMRTIFGSDASRAAALMLELGGAGMRRTQAAIDSYIEMGGAAYTAGVRLDTLRGQMRILKGSIETLQITLGTPFLKPMTQQINSVVIPTVNALADNIDLLQKSDKPLKFFSSLQARDFYAVRAALSEIVMSFDQAGTEDGKLRISQEQSIKIVNALTSGLVMLANAMDWATRNADALRSMGNGILGMAAAAGAVKALRLALAALTSPLARILALASLLGLAWDANAFGVKSRVIGFFESLKPAMDEYTYTMLRTGDSTQAAFAAIRTGIGALFEGDTETKLNRLTFALQALLTAPQRFGRDWGQMFDSLKNMDTAGALSPMIRIMRGLGADPVTAIRLSVDITDGFSDFFDRIKYASDTVRLFQLSLNRIGVGDSISAVSSLATALNNVGVEMAGASRIAMRFVSTMMWMRDFVIAMPGEWDRFTSSLPATFGRAMSAINSLVENTTTLLARLGLIGAAALGGGDDAARRLADSLIWVGEIVASLVTTFARTFNEIVLGIDSAVQAAQAFAMSQAAGFSLQDSLSAAAPAAGEMIGHLFKATGEGLAGIIDLAETLTGLNLGTIAQDILRNLQAISWSSIFNPRALLGMVTALGSAIMAALAGVNWAVVLSPATILGTLRNTASAFGRALTSGLGLVVGTTVAGAIGAGLVAGLALLSRLLSGIPIVGPILRVFSTLGFLLAGAMWRGVGMLAVVPARVVTGLFGLLSSTVSGALGLAGSLALAGAKLAGSFSLFVGRGLLSLLGLVWRGIGVVGILVGGLGSLGGIITRAIIVGLGAIFSPIGLIVAGVIAALVAGLAYREQLADVGQKIRGVLSGFWRSLTSGAEEVVEFLSPIGRRIASALRDVFDLSAFDVVSEWMAKAETWSVENLSAFLGAVDGWVGKVKAWSLTSLPNFFDRVSGWVGQVKGWSLTSLPDFFDKVDGWVERAKGWSLTSLPNFFDTVSGWVGKVKGWSLTSLPNFFDTVSKWVSSLSSMDADGKFAGVFSAVQGWIDTSKEWTMDVLPPFFAQVEGWIAKAKGWTAVKLPAFFARVEEWIARAQKWTMDALPPFFVRVEEWIAVAKQWTMDALPPFFVKVEGWIATARKWTMDELPPFFVKVEGWIATAKQWTMDELPPFFVRVGEWIETARGWTAEKLPDFLKWMKDKYEEARKLTTYNLPNFVGWMTTQAAGIRELNLDGVTKESLVASGALLASEAGNVLANAINGVDWSAISKSVIGGINAVTAKIREIDFYSMGKAIRDAVLLAIGSINWAMTSAEMSPLRLAIENAIKEIDWAGIGNALDGLYYALQTSISNFVEGMTGLDLGLSPGAQRYYAEQAQQIQAGETLPSGVTTRPAPPSPESLFGGTSDYGMPFKQLDMTIANGIKEQQAVFIEAIKQFFKGPGLKSEVPPTTGPLTVDLDKYGEQGATSSLTSGITAALGMLGKFRWPEMPPLVSKLMGWRWPDAPAAVAKMLSWRWPAPPAAIASLLVWRWPAPPAAIVSLLVWRWPAPPAAIVSLLVWRWPEAPVAIVALLAWRWPEVPGVIAQLLAWTWPTPGWVASLLAWQPAWPAWVTALLAWRPPSVNVVSTPSSGGSSSGGGTSTGTGTRPDRSGAASGMARHAGGPLEIGEGGRELVRLPGGALAMATKRMTLNLPRGTSIFSNAQTEGLLRGLGESRRTIPALREPRERPSVLVRVQNAEGGRTTNNAFNLNMGTLRSHESVRDDFAILRALAGA